MDAIIRAVWFLAILCFVFPVHVQSGTCIAEDYPLIWLNGTKTSLSARTLDLTIYGVKPDGSPYTGEYATYSMDRIVERLANGTIYRSLDLYNEANCTIHVIRGELLDSGRVSKDTLMVDVTWEAYPEFKIQFNVSSVNDTLVVRDIPASAISSPYGLQWRFEPDTVKSSFRMENWPWTFKSTSAFLEFRPQFKFRTPEEFFDIRTSYNATTAVTRLIGKRVEVEGVFWSAHLVDDTLYLNPTTVPDGRNLSWPSSVGLPFQDQSISYGGRVPYNYTLLEYDPTLSVLFVPDPDTPNAKSKSSKGWIAAAVVVPIVILLVVVVILLALYWAPLNDILMKR